MKKLRIIMLLMILIAISLSACSSTSTTYTIEQDGITCLVDTINSTIFDGENTYRYSFSGNNSSYTANITYPDGSTYWWEQKGSSGYGGWSDNYDKDRFVEGEVLCDVLIENAPKESNPSKFFIAIILLGIGVFNIISPYTAWYMQYGWRYKDAEPSDAALTINRVLGGVAIIIAVITFFSWLRFI